MLRPAAIILPVLAALLLFASTAYAQPEIDGIAARDREYIRYVKETPASAIDPALPDIPFGKWLESVLGRKAKYKWEVNDCGEQPGFPEPGRDYPVCIEADANLPDGRIIIIFISVGTVEKGLAGKPEFFFGGIEKNGTLKSLKKLSELDPREK